MNNAGIFLERPDLSGDPFYLSGGALGVMLLHGLSATTAEVRLLSEILHHAGYTVHAPLLPGHNTHPSELNNTHRKQWIDAAEQAFLRLTNACNRVVLGGESTGALLCLDLACRHPEVEALLLYAPALKLRLNRFNIFLLRLIAPFVPWVKPIPSTRDLPWRGYSVRPVKAILQLVALQKEVLAQLRSVRQPVLIVQGRLDQTIDAGVPGMLCSQLGSDRIEIHWMQKSTHCVILDQDYETVGEITKRFLQALMDQKP